MRDWRLVGYSPPPSNNLYSFVFGFAALIFASLKGSVIRAIGVNSLFLGITILIGLLIL